MNTNEAYPDNNPKTVLGVAKVPLHLVPPSAVHYLAMAFADGAKKYGPYNWRDKTVSSSVYIAAVLRHIDAWRDGEEESSDAKVHHLAHALACLAIILDAQTIGKLNDDRPTKGAASYLQSTYNKVDKEKQVESKPEPVKRSLPEWAAAERYPLVNSGVSNVQADVFTPDYFGDGRVAGHDKPGNCS